MDAAVGLGVAHRHACIPAMHAYYAFMLNLHAHYACIHTFHAYTHAHTQTDIALPPALTYTSINILTLLARTLQRAGI